MVVELLAEIASALAVADNVNTPAGDESET